MNIMCIYRARLFSPNMESNDAAILDAVAERLREGGHLVLCVHEEDLDVCRKPTPEIIFSMGRQYSTLKHLKDMEEQGVTVFNPSESILNCDRKRFTSLLMQAGIAFPMSRICSPDEVGEWNVFPCWIKKGEGYAQVAADVAYTNDGVDLLRHAREMKERGIQTVVLAEHLNGDLIKFYGVGDSFFSWHYASGSHGKFGLEAINGQEQGFRFAEGQLLQLCRQAAQVLGLKVYGGDCIVAEDGTIRLIDFNDWPSFSKCREQAADAIVKCGMLNK